MDRINSQNEADARTRIQAKNREVILAAGREIFAQHGLRGATLDEIAQTAGMSKANMLYYFKRKVDLYKAVLEEVLTDWLLPLEALDPNGDPIEELRRYISAKMRLSYEYPQASRLFAGEILAGAPHIQSYLSNDLKALVDRKAKTIGGWVADGRLAPIDPYHLIFAIWAMTQHYADFDVQVRAILGRQAGKQGFEDQAAQAILTIVLKGAAPR